MEQITQKIKKSIFQYFYKTELILYLLPVPVLVVLLLLYMETGKSDIVRFLILVAVSSIAGGVFQQGYKYHVYRSSVAAITNKDHKTAIIKLSIFPKRDAWFMLSRWLVVANIIVAGGMYPVHKNFADTLTVIVFISFTGFAAFLLDYLIVDRNMQTVLNDDYFDDYKL